jgi:AhpD family alkylhydroperoxidase
MQHPSAQFQEAYEMHACEDLSEKGKELIAFGAAIAAGCRPCAELHVRAARAHGAEKADIQAAIGRALDSRSSAADHMARLAERLLSGTAEADRCTEPEPAFLGDLVSAGAALAVNCGADLEEHASKAVEQGATEGQIRTAFEIARMVRDMAAGRAEAAAGRFASDVARVGDCRLQQTDCQCSEAESTVGR